MKRTLLLAALAVLPMLIAAQDAKTGSTQTVAKTEIRHVAAQQTSPASGEENYKAYCAACHGTKGKGDGPAASALKVPPTDLTRLTANAGGKYPMLHVEAMVKNADTPAHGSKDMPVWGPVFRSMSSGSQAQVELRVTNLAKYIETLQGK